MCLLLMACSSKDLLVIYLVLSWSWNSEILHAIYSSLQLILCIILILLIWNVFLSNSYKEYYSLTVSHHGVLYSLFLLAFTSCPMSHRGLLHSVIRQVGHWCWCISAMYPVTIMLAAPQSHSFTLLQSVIHQNIKHSLSQNLQSSKLSSPSPPQ